MSENELNYGEIRKRLDLMIYLLITKKQANGEATKKEMIIELYEWGLKDYEIADILGKTRSYVSSEITKFKNAKKKKR